MINPFSSYKILSYYQEAKQILNGEIPVPRMASCWLTTTCNYNCSFCLFKKENRKEHKIANTGKFMKLINELSDMGVEGLELSGGGEPSLHPDFEKISRHGSKKGLKLGLFTNGYRMHQKVLAEIFSYVRVGLDATDIETYEKIKHPPNGTAFNTVLSNIEKLKEMREGTNRPRIGIKFVINKQNWWGIEGMVELAKKCKADYVQFKAEHNGEDVLKESQRTECNETLVALQLTQGKKKPQVVGLLKPQIAKVKCFLSPIHTVIDPEGNVFVCCYLREKKHIIGNAFESSFKKVWGSERHKKILRDLTVKECARWDCRWHTSNKIMHDIIKKDLLDISFI